MKTFIKECRECWIVTLFIVVLGLANLAHLCLSMQGHDFNLPVYLRLLDIFR
jgi:hypothetical protein